MYKVLMLGLLTIFTLSSCKKLGTDYPYDHVPSRYTEAYDISLIFDPVNAVQDIDKALVFANAQNGTSYTLEQSFGRGYDLHLATVIDTVQPKLISIFDMSRRYSNVNLWNASDPNVAKIRFSELNIVDSSKFLYESVSDEKSLKYVLGLDTIIKYTANEIYFIDTTGLREEPRYIYFESYTPGTDSDSKDVKGILKLTDVRYSDQFVKIYLEGKVMYAY